MWNWKDMIRTLWPKFVESQIEQPAEVVQEKDEVKIESKTESKPAPISKPLPTPKTVSRPRPKLKPASKITLEQKSDELHINLGLDWGTALTKVAYRDVGAEEAGLITFKGKDLDNALLPAITYISDTGNIGSIEADHESSDYISVKYLKMSLADMPLPGDRGSEAGSVELDADIVKALSAYYLADIITKSKEWILEHESERAKGREIKWSANVGVPVEQYGSSIGDKFQEVLAVAWEWVQQSHIPTTIDEALRAYARTATTISLEKSPCQAIPEIAAAIYSFVERHDSEPAVYVYADIGAGTLDVVAFRYLRKGGQPRINCYSGAVGPLGLAALAHQLSQDVAVEFDDILQVLATSKLPLRIGTNQAETDSKLYELERNIQRHIAPVITKAKHYDGRDWLQERIQPNSWKSLTYGDFDVQDIEPLLIFIGGGGGGSTWYRNAIAYLYHEHDLLKAGIPPFELLEIPKPEKLNLNGLREKDFHRFAIAYGLSVPYGEGPDYAGPEAFDKIKSVVRPRPRDWTDTKDLM